MKTLILAFSLFSSLAASAQVFVHPNIINLGNSAQVQIHNTTQENINCSGSVYLHTNNGRMESGFFFDYISKGSFSMRSFYLRDFNERITYTSHSIHCTKAN